MRDGNERVAQAMTRATSSSTGQTRGKMFLRFSVDG
jgi:hypothetical protein